MLVLSAASCFAWLGVDSSTTQEQLTIPIVEPNVRDRDHRRIVESLATLWIAVERPPEDLDLMIAESPEINAASFGNGRFLFWKGVADLPDWALDAISAHEVAHDVLLHSRRANDLSALTGFLAEVLVMFGGVDRKTEASLRSWLEAATMPTYSRSQEFAADCKAVELLQQAGYERPGDTFVRTLRILKNRHGDTGGGFFDTHPAPTERILRVLDDYEEKASTPTPPRARSTPAARTSL